LVLFEKNKRAGGRVSTFSQDGFTWDTGATSITPRGKSIERAMLHELDASELVKIEKPIYLHEALRVVPSKVTADRYAYRNGLATLPRMLAEGLDIRFDTQVEEIQREGKGYRMLDESFDAVILTPPIPRTSPLLWGLDESRPMASVFYRSCINVALGYATPLPPTNYYALLDPEQRHPMTWLSLESVKSPARAPEGGAAICLQYSPQFSLDSYQHPDEQLVSTAIFFVEKLYGEAFRHPVSSTVKRWKYSQPESLAGFDEVNPEGTRLFIASDALLGGHIEDAFEVGVKIAARVALT
jgi:predicted NAD/FAD-dependent oxidoreductase